jgi:O-acetyl-ADP-ribose deacetylase (regulator of RNase III)
VFATVENWGNIMNQSERRLLLLQSLLKEQPRYRNMAVPTSQAEQKMLLRGLMNVRPAAPISPEFQQVQDDYLQEENQRRGVVSLSDLTPVQPNMYLWQGDITTLRCGAIVNAANSGMTGCYQPCHNCIDNCIHTYAGIQLRNYCNALMEAQGYPEPTGTAKLTPAFNLPCDYVIHTVGPIVQGRLTETHRKQLASCYRSCLELAAAHQIESIAFCCISTGVFMFPNEDAAKIAVETVRNYLNETGSNLNVVFNVFKDEDLDIYTQLLTRS